MSSQNISIKTHSFNMDEIADDASGTTCWVFGHFVFGCGAESLKL